MPNTRNGTWRALAAGALTAGLCAWMAACGGRGATRASWPDPGPTACGRIEVLQGTPIRLAESLSKAALRVVPIRLTPAQGRWILQDGWRIESGPDAPALLSAGSGTLMIPHPVCAGGEDAPAGLSIEIAESHEEGAAVQPVTASVTATGGTIDETLGVARLEPSGSTVMTIDDPARLLEVRAEPAGALALRRMELPVGRAAVELRQRYRDAIVASSVREAAFRIEVPAAARLRFSVAAADRPFASAASFEDAPPAAPLTASATDPAGSIGADVRAQEFPGFWQLRISVAGDAGRAGRREIFSERVPSPEADSDRWHGRSIDLSEWAGETIDLILSADPEGDPPALALWGSPILSSEDLGSAPRPNILLISVDTLRADRIGRTVGSRPLTPNLDRLAAEGALFTQCRSQAPSTLYGHATMLTGLPPAAHGATTTRALPDAVPYLPSLLARAGYATAAITDDGLLDGRFGFNRGFDRFRNRHEPIEQKVRRALEIAAELPSPWFMFLHTYEVHAPYDPPEEYARRLLGAGALRGAANDILLLTRMNNDVIPATTADVRHFETLYDAEVMRTDAALGRLFAEMKARGLWENAIVAVTSDHGEEFDEHGLIGWHSLTCYEEVQRVPLIVKPAARGSAQGGARRIDATVASLDIAPTILDLAGLDPPASMWGRSLAGLMAGAAAAPDASSPDAAPRETLCEIEDGRGAAILVDGWKYHQRTEASSRDRRTFKRRLRTIGPYGTEELYRIDVDPLEQVNLAAAEPQRALDLRRRLEARLAEARAHLADLTRARPAPPRPRTDEEHLERLRALGYVQ